MESSVRRTGLGRRPKRDFREPIIPMAFPSGALWDTDLTKDEIRHLNPEDKKARPLQSLRRKVAVLESLARNPRMLAAEECVPGNRKELRKWKDPSRGLWTWDDVKLDNENRWDRKEIMGAFWDAVYDIRKADIDRKMAQDQMDERDRTIVRYEQRLAELLVEVQDLRKRVYGR